MFRQAVSFSAWEIRRRGRGSYRPMCLQCCYRLVPRVSICFSGRTIREYIYGAGPDVDYFANFSTDSRAVEFR
jgi:hypothetical protein